MTSSHGILVLIYINEIKGSRASLYLLTSLFWFLEGTDYTDYAEACVIIFFHLKYPAIAMMT